MIFSHGLGGSRNAYSHLVGSVASHGVIVIAPEHRDGSAPISFIRDVPSSNSTSEKSSTGSKKRRVNYVRLPHTPSPEVEAGRNAQLKVRLWELGLIHDSVLKLDLGHASLTNLNTSSISLSPFKNMMDVHRAGKITFAGHSFGAVTVTQFVKSTFYSSRNFEAPASYEPLFVPSSRSAIIQQITPQTPVILLDVWCLPLRAATTRWLWDHPFPCYQPTGPGGSALLAVESQAFFKWREHLKATKRLLSPDPSSSAYDYKNDSVSQPNFYYATSSAHLSQSDFGVLFPWFTKKIFATEEPDRVMKLNVRAVLQLLRTRDIEIGPTCAADMEIDEAKEIEMNHDTFILGRKEEIRGWNWLTTDVNDMDDVDDEEEAAGKADKTTTPGDAVVGNELMKQNETTAVSV